MRLSADLPGLIVFSFRLWGPVEAENLLQRCQLARYQERGAKPGRVDDRAAVVTRRADIRTRGADDFDTTAGAVGRMVVADQRGVGEHEQPRIALDTDAATV